MAVLSKRSKRYKNIKEQLEEFPDEYVKCRAMKHAWGDEVKRRDQDGNWIISHECARCGSEKWQIWSMYGEPEASGYNYSDGYLFLETGPLSQEDNNVIRAVYLDMIPEER